MKHLNTEMKRDPGPYQPKIRSLVFGLAVFCLTAVVIFYVGEQYFGGPQMKFPVYLAMLNFRFVTLFLMALPFIASHYGSQVRQARFSTMDGMTGLYNHEQILTELERELEQAKRHHRSLSTMMIDVDNFKKINDSYGHLAGDQALKNVSSILSKSLRKGDIAGRYGGDEFLVVLPDSDKEDVRRVAERFTRNIQKIPFASDRRQVPLSVSIGVFSHHDGNDVDKATLVDKADRALLDAKYSGKNKILAAA